MGAVPQTVSRERIRGPELAVLRTTINGTPFDKVVPEVDAGNLVMASNRRLTAALVDSDEWQKIRDAFACHTGTHTGYIEPNTAFDEKSLLVTTDRELEKLAGTRYFVEYVDPQTKKHWLFPVHPDYFGKKNVILVAEHPNYTLLEDGDRVITLPTGMNLKEAVDLVEGFPKRDGWYMVDPKHNIPKVGKNDGPWGILRRIPTRVGPAIRAARIFDGNMCVDVSSEVFLNTATLSLTLGTVVEAAIAVAPAPTKK